MCEYKETIQKEQSHIPADLMQRFCIETKRQAGSNPITVKVLKGSSIRRQTPDTSITHHISCYYHLIVTLTIAIIIGVGTKKGKRSS